MCPLVGGQQKADLSLKGLEKGKLWEEKLRGRKGCCHTFVSHLTGDPAFTRFGTPSHLFSAGAGAFPAPILQAGVDALQMGSCPTCIMG